MSILKIIAHNNYAKIRNKKFKGANKMENKHEISGIKCNVSNCVYHAKNDACEAGMIEVGPCSTCNCTTDTCCNTFKAKN